MKSETRDVVSLSRLALSSIRLATKAWPFESGRNLPTRVGALATRIGLLRSAWYEFQPGLWMQLNARDMIPQTILLEGKWDPPLTEFIENNLTKGQTFIDIGAHVGYFSLLAARRVGPTGKVLAIDANPAAITQLEQNVARSNLSNVIVEHTACGGSEGSVTLYYSSESNSSMASLSGANAGTDVKIEVKCTTIDHLIRKNALDRADLIKIDVEGAEMTVLRGMESTIRHMRPTIVLELEPSLLKSFGTTPAQINDFLTGLDYRFDSLGGHSNFICQPN